jgi:D-apiose dehydrogenase
MVTPKKLRFATLGGGFWARYQLAAWGELEDVTCVAIYNRTRSKAEALAREFGIPKVYDDAESMLKVEECDFVDIVTDATMHSQFVHLAARHQLPVICQKPLSPSLDEAERMTAACRRAGAPLLVHENWRWQLPIRHLKAVLDDGRIGTPFRARIDMISGFPVFENQPFLTEIEQFILTDLGTHILDVARFLFGEAESVYCETHRIHQEIRGEDVATVVLSMNGEQTTVACNLAYAGNALERECFPQTLIFIESSRGSVELAPDYWLRVTTDEGTLSRRVPPRMYSWVDPAYAVVQSSIVDCHRDLVQGIRDPSHIPETTADDNLKTLRLVFHAYTSADQHRVVDCRRADA